MLGKKRGGVCFSFCGFSTSSPQPCKLSSLTVSWPRDSLAGLSDTAALSDHLPSVAATLLRDESRTPLSFLLINMRKADSVRVPHPAVFSEWDRGSELEVIRRSSPRVKKLNPKPSMKILNEVEVFGPPCCGLESSFWLELGLQFFFLLSVQGHRRKCQQSFCLFAELA